MFCGAGLPLKRGFKVKSYSGVPVKRKRCIGILTDDEFVSHRSMFVLLKKDVSLYNLGFAGYITEGLKNTPFSCSHVKVEDIVSLRNELGNVVGIDEDGCVNVLWDFNSIHNVLFLTEACNARCIMCPQPPKEYSDIHFKDANTVLDMIKNKDVGCICITGGEPTIRSDSFLKILSRCTREHPTAQIDILTNGQNFSNFEFTKKVAQLATDRVLFCISLHADDESVHDSISCVRGSFAKTHAGLFNLKRFGLRVEMRFVVNKINFNRICNVPDFITRNYPFVEHVALMGLEMTGLAAKNKESVWINPVTYTENITGFVKEASRRGINFSLYNYQLCLIPKSARPYARRSISDWKQEYHSLCLECSFKDECCGFFTTSESDLGCSIVPIKKED